jgi:hypothetical protein
MAVCVGGFRWPLLADLLEAAQGFFSLSGNVTNSRDPFAAPRRSPERTSTGTTIRK